MRNIDWEKFAVIDSDGDHAAVPALCGFFYFAAGVHEVAVELARSVERYVGLVGLAALKSYAAKSGDWKPMTGRQLDRDLKRLRDFPKDHRAVHVEYEAGEGGEPGDFGLQIAAYAEDEDFVNRASLLRVDFPPRWLDGHDVEELIRFVSEICLLPHTQSAQVGLTFKSTTGSHGDAAAEILHKLPRYFGFSPSGFRLYDEILGHTFTAHWLNYVDNSLAAAVGGQRAIVKALPECDVRKLAKGVLIRGAKLPPIGDINRKAPDLGRLPEVARLLKPTRLDIEATYLANEDPSFYAAKWIARLDDMDPRPWDNSGAM